MILLAFETATTAAAVAVLRDGEVVGEVVASNDRHHTESLLPAAAQLLGSIGASPNEIDAVVVDVGPGLFTGLRVGVATARSLAVARGLPLVGLSSLEILASDSAIEDDELVTAVVDARRGEVFAQTFGLQGGVRQAVDAPRVLSPADLAAELANEPRTLVGDGAARHAEAFSSHRIVDVVIPSPAVAGLMAVKRSLPGIDPTMVVPLYLRDPDAVANFTVASQLSR